MQLEYILFKKVTTVDCALRSMAPLTMNTWLGLQYQEWFPYCQVGPESNQTTVGYHQHMGATTALLGMSCHVGHCCGSQTSQLGRAMDWFPPLAAFTIPEGSQGVGFYASYCSNTPSVVSLAIEVYFQLLGGKQGLLQKKYIVLEI